MQLLVIKVPDASLCETDVMEYRRKEPTGYKVPRAVKFIEAVPKFTVYKILRRELRVS